MTTLGRQRSWKLFAGVVCVVVILLSSFMVKPVRAMISNIQMGTILFRFVDEVVLQYPAGQYYINLSWKHKDDLGRIYNDPGNLVHVGKLLQIVQVFIPNKEGVLDEKTKQLIAVAVAHVTQCPYCIKAHVPQAMRKGATKQEIMEAIWVAAEMRAGAAYAHANIAFEAMESDK